MADHFSRLTRIRTDMLRPGDRVAFRGAPGTSELHPRTVIAVYDENGRTKVEMNDITYYSWPGQVWPLMPAESDR